MYNGPKTLQEALEYRYNVWGGNPKGNAYNHENCAAVVVDSHGFHLSYQCGKKPTRGIFCHIHEPEAVAKREAETTKRQKAKYEAEMQSLRYGRYGMRYVKMLAEVARWIAANQDLVENDEWLAEIAGNIAKDETIIKELKEGTSDS